MFDAFQFEIGTMLTPLIWESQKEAHSKCNETQIFLCRSRICSRILFWYCAQTQFHDSNMQMMWCEKKLMICFTFYTWIGTCTTLKIISLPRILFRTVCRSSFTTAAGKNNKTDACVQSYGWSEPEWFHKSSLCLSNGIEAKDCGVCMCKNYTKIDMKSRNQSPYEL